VKSNLSIYRKIEGAWRPNEKAPPWGGASEAAAGCPPDVSRTVVSTLRAQRNPCDARSGHRARLSLWLFHSLEHQFNYSTTGARRIAPLHFISRDRDRSRLLSTYPVRKRTVLDFEREGLPRYRVGA